MKKLLSRPFIFIYALIMLELVLFLTNYTHGTYLIGWDNIMPEFGLALNFKRSIFGIWQEYRGLGLTDGLAHTANLMHTVYIGILALFLPQSLLRYTYTLLTHLIGGIAFFILMRRLTKNDAASFIGALFYQLNLGIIQMYFAPLEVFTTHFAALPIMTLVILNALKEKATKKDYLFIALASFLTSPQGFVPTLFLIYLFLTAAIILISALTKKTFKKSILVFLLVLAGNAFWMLPYSYSAVVTPKVIENARINELGSDEIFYRNKARGDLLSVLTYKGFMSDTIEYDNSKKQDVFFMDAWRQNISSNATTILGLLATISAAIGGFYAIKKRQYTYYPFIITSIFCFIFLANNTLLLDQLNTFIRTSIPVLGEAYRFPFTKLITVFVFCIAILLTYSISLLIERFKKVQLTIITLSLIAILATAAPIYQGNFLSPLLRLNLPSTYPDTFKYLQTVTANQRIATLPLHTFWNWTYRSWGHRGSGFLWYGIEQPILERAFDPWSNFDEQYYNELSYAVKMQDKQKIKNVLDKYDISYLLLDRSVQNTLSSQPINYDSLERLLNSTPYLAKTFNSGYITIYRYTNHSELSTISSKSIKVDINSPEYSPVDTIFQSIQDYIVDDKNPDIETLFPSLGTTKIKQSESFNLAEDSSNIYLTPKNNSFRNAHGKLTIPSVYTYESVIPVRVRLEGTNLSLYPVLPTVKIDGHDYKVPQSPIIIPLDSVSVTNPTSVTFMDTLQKVSIGKNDQYGFILNNALNSIKVQDSQNEQVFTITVDGMPQDAYTIDLPTSPKSITIAYPKITGPLGSDNILKEIPYDKKKEDIIQPFSSKSISEVNPTLDGIQLKAKGTDTHIAFYKDTLLHQTSYLTLFESTYEKGLPLNIYIDNPQEKRSEFESKLSTNKSTDVFILPVSENVFKGYGFHITAKSVGTEVSLSTIKRLAVYPFPLSTLEHTAIDYTTDTIKPSRADKTPLASKKVSITKYIAPLPKHSSYITLSQAYDPGWDAYITTNRIEELLPVLGKRLTQHVKANGWENAWLMEKDTIQKTPDAKVVIIFLPQYLTWLGFIVTFGAILELTLQITLKSLMKRLTKNEINDTIRP